MRRNLRGLIFLPTFLAACSMVGCDNEYAVEQCIPNHGIVIDNKDAPRIGPTFAKVNLTVFGDFQCPGTHWLWYSLSQFLAKLEEDGKSHEIRIDFRHFPLTSIHNHAGDAALAAAAAHRQGNYYFWILFPKLLKQGAELTPEHILMYAQSSGLDMAQFTADIHSPEVLEVVNADLDLARELELPGTPSMILCGIHMAATPEDLVENLEHLLY